jgi:hypothetical protein
MLRQASHTHHRELGIPGWSTKPADQYSVVVRLPLCVRSHLQHFCASGLLTFLHSVQSHGAAASMISERALAVQMIIPTVVAHKMLKTLVLLVGLFLACARCDDEHGLHFNTAPAHSIAYYPVNALPWAQMGVGSEPDPVAFISVNAFLIGKEWQRSDVTKESILFRVNVKHKVFIRTCGEDLPNITYCYQVELLE